MRRTASAAALALAIAAAALPAAAQDGVDEEGPARAIALGPIPSGSANVTLDVGWLRTGIRADAGLGKGFDLFARADAFLLHEGLGGQNGVHAGLRFSPMSGTGLRLSLSGELGFLLVTETLGSSDQVEVRGEAVLGYGLADVGLPYVRGALRTLRFSAPFYSGWDRDAELGLGFERPWRRILLAAEAFLWFQPDVPALGQWRLRAGFAF